MRKYLVVIFLFSWGLAFGQFPPSQSKFLLNDQTTSRGLTYHGNGVPIWQPTGMYDTREYQNLDDGNRYYWNETNLQWETYFYFGPSAPSNIAGPPAVVYTTGLWYDSDDNILFFWGGSAWLQVGTGGIGTTQNYQKNGAFVGAQPALNFIEGTNVTLDVVNNPGANRIDVTVNSTAAGGGSFDSFFVTDGTDTEEVTDGATLGVLGGVGVDFDLSGLNTTATLNFGELGTITAVTNDKEFTLWDLATGQEQKINSDNLREWIVDYFGTVVLATNTTEISTSYNDALDQILISYTGNRMEDWTWGTPATQITIGNGEAALVDGQVGIAESMSASTAIIDICFGCGTTQKLVPENGDFLLIQDGTDFQYKYITLGDLPSSGMNSFFYGNQSTVTAVTDGERAQVNQGQGIEVAFTTDGTNHINTVTVDIENSISDNAPATDDLVLYKDVSTGLLKHTEIGSLPGGGGGTMNNFDVTGSIGSTWTIGDGDLLTIAGGTGILSTSATTDQVLLSLNFGGLGTTGTVDGTEDLIAWYDESAGNHLAMTFDELTSIVGGGGSSLWTDAGTHTYLTDITSPVSIGASGTLGNNTLYLKAITGTTSSHHIMRLQSQNGNDVADWDAQGKITILGVGSRAIDIENDADIRFVNGAGGQVQWGSGGPFIDQSGQGLVIRGSSSSSSSALTIRGNNTDFAEFNVDNGMEIDKITTRTNQGTLTISGWNGASGTPGGNLVLRGGTAISTNLGTGGDVLIYGGHGRSGSTTDTAGIVQIKVPLDAGGALQTLLTATNEWIRLGPTGIGTEPNAGKVFHTDGELEFDNLPVNNAVTTFLGLTAGGEVVETDGSSLPGGGANLGNSNLTQTDGTRTFDVANQSSGIFNIINWNRLLIGTSGPSGILDLGNNPDANQQTYVRAGSSSNVRIEAGNDYIQVFGNSGLINFATDNVVRARVRSEGIEPAQYSVPPVSPNTGTFYYNTTMGDLQVYDGSDYYNLGRLTHFTTAGRPASPRAGTMIWNTTDTKAQVWTGSAWVDLH